MTPISQLIIWLRNEINLYGEGFYLSEYHLSGLESLKDCLEKAEELAKQEPKLYTLKDLEDAFNKGYEKAYDKFYIQNN